MAKHEFDAAIEEGRGSGAWVAIPFNVEDAFGTKGQVKVKATFDGHAYRGSLAPMGGGGGTHILGVRKAIREAIGKTIGGKVHVVLERDTEPRVVQIPKDLKTALNENPRAKKNFAEFAFTYKKEYARWIDGAKKQETRERRLRKAIEKISRGEKL